MKVKKTLFITILLLSILLAIFGYLYIPILSYFGVKFPAKNFVWGLSIIPTVILFQVPLILCVNKMLKNHSKIN